jgi:hypothetical protein
MLAVSLSATDYVGHATGTQGPEMCLQLATVDQALGAFFAALDARGIDYGVVLSADHGGFDMPERQNREAMPQVARADAALLPKALSAAVAARTGLPAQGLILAMARPAISGSRPICPRRQGPRGGRSARGAGQPSPGGRRVHRHGTGRHADADRLARNLDSAPARALRSMRRARAISWSCSTAA